MTDQKIKEAHKDAVAKLQGLVKDVPICMMATISKEGILSSRPMTTIKVDDDGNLWFFTDDMSGKVEDQEENHIVYLIYSDPGTNTYVHVRANSSVIRDRSRMESLWNPVLRAWYPKGVDDSALCLLKVMPEEAQFWNASSNKMMVFLNMAKAIITGERYDEGEHGTLSLNREDTSIH